MSNFTIISESPPLPSCTLRPTPSLIEGVPDIYLSIWLPIIAYWIWSLVFYSFDVLNLFEKYKIHTPEEIKSRNLVPISEVVFCVLIQQLWQIGLGIWMYSGPDLVCGEEYDTAVWATRIRNMQRHFPKILAAMGINSKAAAPRVAPISRSLAGILYGGGKFLELPKIGTVQPQNLEPEFLFWELIVANVLYYYAVPASQFAVAIFVGDTWQFWLHLISHRVPWIYNKIHSVHHRVYCPYPFGAFYANLVEAFVWDVGGTALGLWLSGLSQKQAIWFITLSVMKSCDDHCGYNLPFDPFQWISEQNAAYHDIHHQSWGMKTNFSQVYTSFWDRLIGTRWTGDDLDERYKRGRKIAERAIDREKAGAK